MLGYDQQKKLSGEWDWGDGSAQQKAEFNKKMRLKLKTWLKEMPSMIAILKGLPPRVKKNAKLEDDLPGLIAFVDIFLETINPLPVGTHHLTGEKCIFENLAVAVGAYSDLLNESIFCSLTGKKYVVRTKWLVASPIDVLRHELLKKHVQRMQLYIDPSAAVVVGHNQLLERDLFLELYAEQRERLRVFGQCDGGIRNLSSTNLIPTEPPSSPKIIELEEEPK